MGFAKPEAGFEARPLHGGVFGREDVALNAALNAALKGPERPTPLVVRGRGVMGPGTNGNSGRDMHVGGLRVPEAWVEEKGAASHSFCFFECRLMHFDALFTCSRP